ncbi:hypothetical protein X975_04434, partial [Stegodyphus mimosarum]
MRVQLRICFVHHKVRGRIPHFPRNPRITGHSLHVGKHNNSITPADQWSHLASLLIIQLHTC